MDTKTYRVTRGNPFLRVGSIFTARTPPANIGFVYIQDLLVGEYRPTPYVGRRVLQLREIEELTNENI